MNKKPAHEIVAQGYRSRISTINYLIIPRLFLRNISEEHRNQQSLGRLYYT